VRQNVGGQSSIRSPGLRARRCRSPRRWNTTVSHCEIRSPIGSFRLSDGNRGGGDQLAVSTWMERSSDDRRTRGHLSLTVSPMESARRSRLPSHAFKSDRRSRRRRESPVQLNGHATMSSGRPTAGSSPMRLVRRRARRFR
jgi:hypothetical protein